MPKGTKVEKVYQALKEKRMSKGKAAAIAQANTGLSLTTGKKPKNSMRAMMDGDSSVAKKVAKKG
jgi:hypothetical protein